MLGTPGVATRPVSTSDWAGEDYYFVTREKMEADLGAGLFVEAGQYNGNFYGTSLQAVRLVASEVCLFAFIASHPALPSHTFSPLDGMHARCTMPHPP